MLDDSGTSKKYLVKKIKRFTTVYIYTWKGSLVHEVRNVSLVHKIVKEKVFLITSLTHEMFWMSDIHKA